MNGLRMRTLLLSLAAAAITTTEVTTGRADEISTCASSHLASQELRDATRLRAARAQLLVCSRRTCPNAIRVACDAWLTDLDARLPTLVIGAQDAAGHDLADVHVSMDGAPLLESLDGKAVPVDPGAHVLRFERPPALALEERIVVREGEKSRPLVVRFPGDAAKAARAPQEGAAARPPVLAYVIGGVGLASLVGFSAIGLGNQGTFDDCERHGCSASTKDRLSTEQHVAWVLLGVSVVSFGVATWLLLSNDSHAAPRAVGLRGRVLPGGGGLELGSTF